ncbi:MAG: hypothetical protein FWD09_02135 [Lentimicrobiaceae bacterium]|nr:hypothetical protein [Lentimicrobiaceae bacterium]
MVKIKSIPLFLFILLFFNCLCFSQSKVSYIDLITENHNEYKTFQRNFNPLQGKHDPAILKSCFLAMVNDLRQQLYGGAPLVHLPMLDSVALMQAEFQVFKNKVTTINEPPFKFTAQRLRKYGFTTQGDEFASKAKAHQGDKDYSYYDLCLELLKPLLKSPTGLPAILSPQYTIFGFAFEIDKYMNSVYISVILGNDLTIQVFNSVGSKQKDLPISRGQAGLLFYDDETCRKIATDPTLEQIYDMLYRDENGDLFLQSDDAKWAKRLLSKAGTAIVLDFIQKEQYNCRTPQIDNNKPFRGIVSKPVSMEKIFAANDSSLKSNIFHAKIGSIPDRIELDKAIDINILLIGNKKYVCRTLIKKNVSNIRTSDAIADSLIQALNFEEALYHLAPMLSDSTINESLLFSIVQLAAHKPQTYLSSIFTQSVQMAILRNPLKLCELLDEFSVSVFDNAEVRKIYCSTCN